MNSFPPASFTQSSVSETPVFPKQSCNTFIITKLCNPPFHENAFLQFEITIHGAALKFLVQIF